MNLISQMNYSETLRLHLATTLAQTLCLVKVYEIAPTVYPFTSIIQSPSLCNQTTNHLHGNEQSLLRCFKDGWKAETCNHSPIASLSKLSLALERIVYRTILKHIQNKVSPHQFGFRKSRACCTQLPSFFDKIFEWLILTKRFLLFI